MGSIQRLGAAFGVMLLAGCAEGAQAGVAAPGTTTYFQSGEATPPASTPTASGPFAWSRVEPRFRISADDLAADVGDWTRGARQPSDVARVLTQLAEALDATPRPDGRRAVGTADGIRAIAASLRSEPSDSVAQRRAIGEALFIASWQMTSDAQQAYAADPNVARAAADLRRAAVAIFETGPDAPIEDGLVAARDAVQAFQIAIARGLVNP